METDEQQAGAEPTSDLAAVDSVSLLAGVRAGRYDDPALLVSIVGEALGRVQHALLSPDGADDLVDSDALATAANERLEQLGAAVSGWTAAGASVADPAQPAQ